MAPSANVCLLQRMGAVAGRDNKEPVVEDQVVGETGAFLNAGGAPEPAKCGGLVLIRAIVRSAYVVPSAILAAY